MIICIRQLIILIILPYFLQQFKVSNAIIIIILKLNNQKIIAITLSKDIC